MNVVTRGMGKRVYASGGLLPTRGFGRYVFVGHVLRSVSTITNARGVTAIGVPQSDRLAIVYSSMSDRDVLEDDVRVSTEGLTYRAVSETETTAFIDETASLLKNLNNSSQVTDSDSDTEVVTGDSDTDLPIYPREE